MGSITPGVATPRFVAELTKWDTTGKPTSETITEKLPANNVAASNVSFYKPFVGKLSVQGGKIKPGSRMEYTLERVRQANESPAKYFDTRIENYGPYIQAI